MASADSATMQVTDETFAKDVMGAEGLVLVDFWAVWCGPCQFIAPVLEDLATEYADKGVKVAKLDVDSNQRTSMEFGVRSIPSVLYFKGGKHVDTVVGAVPRDVLESKIKQHLA